MPLFAFISGYLYKTSNERSVFSFIRSKFLRLIIPMYISIAFYSVLCYTLKRYGLLGYGIPHTWFNFFIEPWAVTTRYGLTDAYWFITTLYILHMVNILVRRSLHISGSNVKEIVYLFVCLYFSFMTVNVSQNAGGWFGDMKRPTLIFVHVCFLLPFYQMGHVIAKWRECSKMINEGSLFVIIVVQLVLMYFSGGIHKMYNTVIYANFGVNPYLSLLMATNGIMFWYVLSGLVYQSFYNFRFVNETAKNTIGIVFHHQLGIYVFNWLIVGVSYISRGKLFGDIEIEKIVKSTWYTYAPEDMVAFRYLYVLFSIIFALYIHKGYCKVAELVRYIHINVKKSK